MTFYRPTWVEINLSAFHKNLRTISSRLSPGAKVIAVLKADGYGHGAFSLAKEILKDSGFPLWGFGVSSVEEGIGLRSQGISMPILILGSLFPFDSFEAALENDLTPTVASLRSAKEVSLQAEKMKKKAKTHLKVDTGMGRIGVSPERAEDVLSYISQTESLSLEGVYTHFAQADSLEVTRKQLALFSQVIEKAKGLNPNVLAHSANSHASLHIPESHFNAVRPGLSLYGAHSFPELKKDVVLQPILTWKTRVVFIKTVPKGTPISYGGDYVTKKEERLATLPVGYADGYQRLLSRKGHVLIQGKKCPVVGRVTMDQIIVDVTGIKNVGVGDEVVLIGAQGDENISVEDMASWSDTISYEVFCGIGQRVPRVLLQNSS